ncbi:hypothetical protein FNV43_RR05247 [Rhamnella rubrinervis]|uniref:Uncharacterized protein n=1 Tax=Rhamnella rubrinervis TaxID=2594499 RepID=A0A8K0HNL6_9ROSA|nr:hypothetical protein FNV43_RR05247 [Rhamnella rubrinervis]
MGDKARLTKAIIQLEELYSGIPDESVDLTFQHLANVKQNAASISPEKRKTINDMMEAIPEVDTIRGDITPMRKLPSLDFSRGLQATNTYNHSLDGGSSGLVPVASRGVQLSTTHTSPLSQSGFSQAVENSNGDVSMASNSMYHHHQDHRGGGRRRPGIPHSNICTICSTSVFIFKHRCLSVLQGMRRHRHG